MSLSPVKYKILECMLLKDKPAKAMQIAKDCGNSFKPVMMHLIGLTKMGYTASPEKGHYVITQKGKVALGIPETSKESAKQILSGISRENAFHFYSDLDKPLNFNAHGLKEFADKIQTVDASSLDFHFRRGDFEKWFTSLGDAELAKKMALLKETGPLGEQLRTKLREIVENRCIELSVIT